MKNPNDFYFFFFSVAMADNTICMVNTFEKIVGENILNDQLPNNSWKGITKRSCLYFKTVHTFGFSFTDFLRTVSLFSNYATIYNWNLLITVARHNT